MSKAKTDLRNAPVRRYLLRDLARAGLSGLQAATVFYMMDQTYGWKRPGQPLNKVRKDRTEVDFDHAAQALNSTPRSTRKAFRELVNLGVLTEYQKPSRWTMGVFGINSETAEWTCLEGLNSPPQTVSAECTDSVSRRREQCQQSAPIVSAECTDSVSRVHQRCRQNAANPHGQRASSPPNIDLNIDLNHDLNRGGGSIFDPIPENKVKIRNPQEAARTTLTIQEAAGQAEGAYLEAFSMPLSAVERVDLINWIKLGSTPQGMLAAWLMAITSAQKERHEKRADPKQRQFVSRRPFKDVMRHGAEVYESIKARRSLGSVPREPNLN